MTPSRAAAVLAQVQAGPAHNWAAECLASEGGGEVGARFVRLLAAQPSRRAEAIALLREVIEAGEVAG